MIQSFKKIEKISGELTLPGDKSISHRALIFSALSEGESRIQNLPNSDDVNSTIRCLRDLGVEIRKDNNLITAIGKGFKGFRKPAEPLNAGNSGTTARLLSGILSVQNFQSTLVGDSSLSIRPMKRIIEPLSMMGTNIRSSDSYTLPLTFNPPSKINSIKYELPVPSAQVKSAILLAGMHCDETTTVIENAITRDHTERMLGLKVEKTTDKIFSFVSRSDYPEAQDYYIPGDISSAAYFIVLTLLTKNSCLTLKNVSLNPIRIGFLEILMNMGGDIIFKITHSSNNESYGDVVVNSSELENIEITKDIIPRIIDEIPILAVAGVFAKGNFELRFAEELRVKESDRIHSACRNFAMLDLDVEELNDGFKISGNIKIDNPVFNSFGDHRIAMAFGILSSLLENGGQVDGFECVSVSNPDYLLQLNSITSEKL